MKTFRSGHRYKTATDPCFHVGLDAMCPARGCLYLFCFDEANLLVSGHTFPHYWNQNKAPVMKKCARFPGPFSGPKMSSCVEIVRKGDLGGGTFWPRLPGVSVMIFPPDAEAHNQVDLVQCVWPGETKICLRYGSPQIGHVCRFLTHRHTSNPHLDVVSGLSSRVFVSRKYSSPVSGILIRSARGSGLGGVIRMYRTSRGR